MNVQTVEYSRCETVRLKDQKESDVELATLKAKGSASR
jgi:hypothetical protein